MKRMTMTRDLTTGDAQKVLWRFCLPLFASVIFQQLYNIADSLVAGKFIGENALAAVGNSYEITLIFIAFAFGCNIGCSVTVSQLFGAGNVKDMKTAVHTTFIAGGVLCGALMLFGLTQGGVLLQAIHTPQAVLADSALYLDIYVLGLPFLFFYNIATGIFSAMGDSKTPFFFLAVSSVTNIGMDILFVRSFGMGVAGVAWATFLCQGVSCLLAVGLVLVRLAAIPCTEKAPLFSWPLLGRIAVVAVPSILQQSFVSVGNIIIQGTINGFGTGVMAGYSAAIKLNNLVITSLTTLGNGVSNYTAQNIGAGKLPRVKQGFAAGVKLVACLSLPMAVLYFVGGGALLRLFLDDTGSEALATGVQFLRIVSPFYFVVAVKLVADGVLRGARMMGRFMLATFTDLTLRVVLALVLAPQLGATGVWLAWPLGWCVAAGISVLCYRTGAWGTAKNTALLGAQA